MSIAIIAKKIADRLPQMPWTGDPYRRVIDSLVDARSAGDLVGGDALSQIFLNKAGGVVDKWLQYLPVYERYLSRFRNTPVRVLEIGVNKGGSLELWRDYLGPRAVIFGVDVDPACAAHAEPPNQVRIGSQDDAPFLARTVAEMGGVDVVLDDGSHIVEHQRASFRALFPLLSDHGLYFIEDLHTSYWPRVFHGGYRRRSSTIEMLKDAIDDMHHWYHGRKPTTATQGNLSAVHFYDSIAVVEKFPATAPVRALSGDASEVTKLLGANYRG